MTDHPLHRAVGRPAVRGGGTPRATSSNGRSAHCPVKRVIGRAMVVSPSVVLGSCPGSPGGRLGQGAGRVPRGLVGARRARAAPHDDVAPGEQQRGDHGDGDPHERARRPVVRGGAVARGALSGVVACGGVVAGRVGARSVTPRWASPPSCAAASSPSARGGFRQRHHVDLRRRGGLGGVGDRGGERPVAVGEDAGVGRVPADALGRRPQREGADGLAGLGPPVTETSAASSTGWPSTFQVRFADTPPWPSVPSEMTTSPPWAPAGAAPTSASTPPSRRPSAAVRSARGRRRTGAAVRRSGRSRVPPGGRGLVRWRGVRDIGSSPRRGSVCGGGGGRRRSPGVPRRRAGAPVPGRRGRRPGGPRRARRAGSVRSARPMGRPDARAPARRARCPAGRCSAHRPAGARQEQDRAA